MHENKQKPRLHHCLKVFFQLNDCVVYDLLQGSQQLNTETIVTEPFFIEKREKKRNNEQRQTRINKNFNLALFFCYLYRS